LTSIKRRIIDEYGEAYWEREKEVILSRIGLYKEPVLVNSYERRLLQRKAEREQRLLPDIQFRKEIDDIIFRLHKFLFGKARTLTDRALSLAKPQESLYSRRIAKEVGIPRSTLYNRLKKAKALE